MNTRISVLIPFHNCDCRALVHALIQEITQNSLPVEIIVANDGSNDQYCDVHDGLKKIKEIHYIHLLQNIGRSRIRNLLASKAKGEWLLFLDNDVMPENKTFLAEYLKSLNEINADIICGGRSYCKQKPENSELTLHWVYGVERESKNATERNKNPYKAFQSNNFVLSMHAFAKLKFDEEINQYGHEDTLYGMEAETMGLKILHIDNPAKHLGLESRKAFIDKTEKAVENAVRIYRERGLYCNRATRLGVRIHKLIPPLLLSWCCNSQLIQSMKSSLLNTSNDLIKLDLYKLFYTLKQL
jgi:glycosyltransferase involved in cell wall biosynthesis